MVQKRLTLLIAICVAMAGCSTTGGTIGGLVPAPKFLKGEIKDDIYTAKDKSFSVGIPHKRGSYEYTYMQVKEQYSEYGAYISFGPAAADQSVYRIETARQTTPESRNLNPMEVVPQILENYKSQLQKGYGSAPQEIASGEETINGRQAYRWAFTQVVPAGKYYSNKEANLSHEAYAIVFDTGAVFVWVQVPDVVGEHAMQPRAFAESVVWH